MKTRKKQVSINNQNGNFDTVQNNKLLAEKVNHGVPIDGNGNPTLKCDICSCVFNSQTSIDQHMTGKKHLTKVEEMKTAPNKAIDYDLHCSICNAYFNSQTSAEQHYMGRRHAETIEAQQGHYNSTTCYVFKTTRSTVTLGTKHKLVTCDTG